MKEEKVRKAVRQRYGKIAKSETCVCGCSSNSKSKSISEQIG
jgi:hypothetical protein